MKHPMSLLNYPGQRGLRPVVCAAFIGLLAAAFSSVSLAADANKPASYAVRLPITVAPDAPLQRLQLPAQALVQLQSSRYNDVRIFNAQGQPVPMALSTVATSPAERGRVLLVAFPILGSESTPTLDGLQLRIEERQGKRVVQINSGKEAVNPAAQKVLGVLLDARDVKTPVVAIALDVDIPTAKPITFTIERSEERRVGKEC